MECWQNRWHEATPDPEANLSDTPRPHVHLTVQAEGLDRTRFNPRPVQLNCFRERFARELRARGVAAEATPRRARGQGIAGSSMALVKIRARLRAEGSLQISNSDRRTNEQAIAVARGRATLPAFIARGTERWQAIRAAYSQAAAVLDATGAAEDRELASDVRGFLGKHQGMNATPEIFAARYAQNLGMKLNNPEPQAPDPPPLDRNRSRYVRGCAEEQHLAAVASNAFAPNWGKVERAFEQARGIALGARGPPARRRSCGQWRTAKAPLPGRYLVRSTGAARPRRPSPKPGCQRRSDSRPAWRSKSRPVMVRG